MSEVREKLKYAKSHEWLKAEGSLATMGITDHAQAELTDIVFADLPKIGAEYKAGQVIAVVESVKAASDIYAPVSGKVIEVNEAVSADPSLINTSPYENGWLVKIELVAGEDYAGLMDNVAYQQHVG
jgi:glycine cleavage system H protein